METNSPLVSRWLNAFVGLVAGGFGIAVATLVASFARSTRSPVLDVGDRVVDAVPTWAKNLAIDWFGTKDKIALLVGIGSMLAVYAAFLGVVALRRNLKFAIGGAVLFGLIGSWAALNARTGGRWYYAIPSLVGAAAVAVVLVGARMMLDRESADASADQGMLHPSARRRFLVGVGAVTAVGVGTGFLGTRLENRFNAGSSRQQVAETLNTGGPAAAPAGAQAEGAASFFTPNADFYRIDTALTVPQVPADSWRLRVKGMVDQPLELSYDDLIARGLVESDITLTCVSNLVGGGLVGTARWQGIRLDDLLNEAGIDPAADQIVGRSVDGYTCGFPVAALDGRDALVAIAMNGEPLPLEHGFPARLIVPGIYGYASATKWLTEIELTTFDSFDHYWVPRGYSALAEIKMQTRIDSPRGLDRISAGPFAIGGTAWAQPVGIRAVELSIDEGPWIQADMATEVNGSTWRQWTHAWQATPGRHTITARAIDKKGAIQTADRSEPLPDGVTGHHTVVVLVDEV